MHINKVELDCTAICAKNVYNVNECLSELCEIECVITFVKEARLTTKRIQTKTKDKGVLNIILITLNYLREINQLPVISSIQTSLT